MRSMLYIFVICFFSVAHCSPINTTEHNETIEKLEIEEKRVYKKVKAAINDAVKYLSKSNDTDAAEGFMYMKELKKQLKELYDANNGTELDVGAENDTDVTTAENRTELTAPAVNLSAHYTLPLINDNKTLGTNETSRRNMLFINKKGDALKSSIVSYSQYKPLGKVKVNKLNILDQNRKVRKKWQNRIDMENKLAAWVAQKEKERQLILMYKLSLLNDSSSRVTEKCPPQGIDEKHKNKDKKKDKNKPGRKYPCCRKCCKKSYLGCL